MAVTATTKISGINDVTGETGLSEPGKVKVKSIHSDWSLKLIRFRAHQ